MEIKFRDVDFKYQKVNYIEKEVLKDLNFEFQKNKINALIGKSGSGKTTLVHLINNLVSPTKGVVQVGPYMILAGKKLPEVEYLRFDVGLVSQFPEEDFFNRTVKQELELILYLTNYKLREKEKRVLDSLKMVGLSPEYLYLNPNKLSISEARKVALAQALLINPKVLIVDEPTVGLDSKSKNDLIKLFRTLKNRYQKTIIIISHDVDFLHKFVDYVYVLNDKHIVLEGSKYDVFKNKEVLKKCGLKQPKIIEFEDKVLARKNIKIGYRDDINDLIKDIYRYVK